MKKVVICSSFIVVSTLLFSACAPTANGNINTHFSENTVQQAVDDAESASTAPTVDNIIVKFESGVYFDKNWDETVGTYEGPVIPNEETAIEVAKSIFNGMEKGKDAQKYVPQAVFYDEQDSVWIVSLWAEASKNETNGYWVGGDCSIALQKEDGKVLRIWYGE